jgi:hypothetical protein
MRLFGRLRRDTQNEPPSMHVSSDVRSLLAGDGGRYVAIYEEAVRMAMFTCAEKELTDPGVDVVFAADASGSMLNSYRRPRQGGLVPIAVVASNIAGLARALGGNGFMPLLVFNTTARQIQGFAPRRDLTHTLSQLLAVKPAGGTCFVPPIRLASTLRTTTERPQLLVLLTDGDNRDRGVAEVIRKDPRRFVMIVGVGDASPTRLHELTERHSNADVCNLNSNATQGTGCVSLSKLPPSTLFNALLTPKFVYWRSCFNR